MRGVKSSLYVATQAFRPWAALRSRKGYFAERDWGRLSARKIAIVACHWLGDTLWAAQVVPALERRFPEADLYAITKPFAADLWHGAILPQRVLSAPEVVSDRRREPFVPLALRRRARELRRQEFDLVIDLTGNRYSAWFTYLLRPGGSVGFDGGELGWLYSLRVAQAERPGRHLSERPFRVIEPLLAATDWPPEATAKEGEPLAYRLPLRPPSPTCTVSDIRSHLNMTGQQYFVLAPGAGWPDKRWPAEKFIEAGAKLAELPCRAGMPDLPTGRPVVVVGAHAEEDLCRQVSAGIPGSHVCTGRPIGQVIALLSRALGVLSNDSGIAHLAAALGRPTAAVFTGATDPQLCRPLGDPEAVKVFQASAPVETIVAHLRRP